MSQETRKDKRANVVSLNVRYKSATVDEFIENHSHDVSKGGIFVKTANPFPPGTLLKFEIRLAGDKSVISGVGRVVWKREPTQASAEKPAGMGVKFIKIGDASRAIIERLVAEKADAGSAYTSDPAALEDDSTGPPTTLRGIPAAPNAPASLPLMSAGPPITAPAPVLAVEPPVPTSAPAAITAKPPPTPSPASPSAPKSPGGPRPPVPPRAVPPTPSPKVAAEKAPAAAPPVMSAMAPPIVPAPRASEPGRAGGPPPTPRATVTARKATMMGVALPAPASAPGADKRDPPVAELPQPPVVAQSPAAPQVSERTPSPKAAIGATLMFPTASADRGPSDSVKEPTVMKQAAELLEEALREAGGSLDEIGQNPLFMQSSQRSGAVEEARRATKSEASGMSNTDAAPVLLGTKKAAASSPPKTHAAAPASAASSSAMLESSAKSTPPPAEPIGASIYLPEKKGAPVGLIAGFVIVVVLVGAGVFAYKSTMLSSSTPTPAPTPTASSSSGDRAAAVDAGSTANVVDGGVGAAFIETVDAGARVASDAGALGVDVTEPSTKVVEPTATPRVTAPTAPTGATPTAAQPTRPKPRPAAPKPTSSEGTSDPGQPAPPTATTTPEPTPSAPPTASPEPAPPPAPAPSPTAAPTEAPEN